MGYRKFRVGALALALFSALLIQSGFSQPMRAAVFAPPQTPVPMPQQNLLHRADTFKNCQQIHWCGVRRDGRPWCGPAWRCRECKFVRTCQGGLGCFWEEKCRWGPYQPPIPQ